MGGDLKFMHGVVSYASGSYVLVAYRKQLVVATGKRAFCLVTGYEGG